MRNTVGPSARCRPEAVRVRWGAGWGDPPTPGRHWKSGRFQAPCPLGEPRERYNPLFMEEACLFLNIPFPLSFFLLKITITVFQVLGAWWKLG